MPTKNPLHIPLRDIPPAGRSWLVNDAAVWEGPLQEFHMDCRLAGTPQLEVNILPVDEGWLLRGRLRASVILPCSRCTADVALDLDEPYEDYVQQPEADEALPETDFAQGDDHLIFEHGALMLDLSAIAWEQFALALPATPLCRPDCRGLCPRCGADLNLGPCGCAPDDGDPRLAVLRGLRIEKS